MTKFIKPILFLTTLFLLTACGGITVAPAEPEFEGAAYPEPQPVDDFTLMSVDGPVSLDDLAGKYTYIYFGYTYCPDVCPATLSQLARVKERLGADGSEMQVVMITVDPERDTPEKLAEYLHHFDPDFVGLSGDSAEIDAAGKPFGLYYERHEGSTETGYLVDHTARTFLLNRNGDVILSYAFDTPTDAFYNDFQKLLDASDA